MGTFSMPTRERLYLHRGSLRTREYLAADGSITKDVARAKPYTNRADAEAALASTPSMEGITEALV